MSKPDLGHFDYLTTKIIKPTVGVWHSLGFITPNILTTFGLISSLLGCYYLYKKRINLAIMFIILKLYFDWIDGIYARKYKQASIEGDWYDHISDIVFFILLLYVFIIKGKFKQTIVIIFFGILASLQIGCSQKKYNEQTPNIPLAPTIDLVSKLCIFPQVLRWLDTTLWYIILIIIIKFFYI